MIQFTSWEYHLNLTVIWSIHITHNTGLCFLPLIVKEGGWINVPVQLKWFPYSYGNNFSRDCECSKLLLMSLIKFSPVLVYRRKLSKLSYNTCNEKWSLNKVAVQYNQLANLGTCWMKSMLKPTYQWRPIYINKNQNIHSGMILETNYLNALIKEAQKGKELPKDWVKGKVVTYLSPGLLTTKLHYFFYLLLITLISSK